MSKVLVEKKSVNKPIRKIKTNQLKRKAKLARKVISAKNKVDVASVPKKKNAWRKPRGGKGVVYLSHIPHGFYEDQIEAYFKQFGKISAVSVPRSKTGKSKGYAFVEFAHPEVARIAADTMNNYLMCNRLIKAKYIPPQQQKPRFFIAAVMAREQHKTLPEKAKLQVEKNRKVKNRKLKINLEAKVAVKLARKKKMLKSKIEKLGLDYDFEVEEGDIESIIKKKKEQQEKKKENMQVTTLSNEDSSVESDEELHSLEENKMPEIIASISEKQQQNLIKQKISKTSLRPLQNSPNVQKKQNKTNTESPRATNMFLKSGKLQNEVLTSIEKKLKTHIKNLTTPITSTTEMTQSNAVVMEVDENDEEISFKTPPNVLKKSLNPKVSRSNTTPKNRNKSNFKATPRESSKFPLNTSSGEQI